MLPKKLQPDFYNELLKDIWETLNPLGSDGVFVILRGFIDESFDHNLFVLSALTGVGTIWRWLSRDWLACIERRNERLRSEGRSPITRFHASECNSQDNEYEGWSRQEQIEFMAELIAVLGKYELHSTAWALDLEDYRNVFPDARSASQSELLTLAYGFMTKFMAYRLAPLFVAADPAVRITLVHDRCAYDGVMADAFRKAVEDTGFKERGCYTSIAPASSLDVIPLQMADLLSHENFKETKRRYKSGKKDLSKRRTSLKVLIRQGNIGGGVEYIQLQALRAFADYVNRTKAKNARTQTSESLPA